MAHQTIISATEGHRAFGKLLKRVFRSDEHLIVERDGFPVAVLMSFQEYEKLRGQQAVDAFQRFSRELGREVERQGIGEEELLEELKQVRREVFDEAQADLVASVETRPGAPISPRELAAIDALDHMGEALKGRGISLEELIEAGCDVRGQLLEEDYGIKATEA